MPKQVIKVGFTNEKHQLNNEFVVKKIYNGFNHQIDYKILAQFDFVPKLIRENDEEVVWEFIDGEMLKHPSLEDLKQVATILRQLHKSDLIFPKNNFRKRYTQYLKIAHNKGIKMPEVELNWKKMNNLVSKMQRINPCHNDLWWENFLKDKNGKIWLIDWEYATMGDKHFDLAYLIESWELNEEQEAIFLKTYNAFDDYQAWIPEWMPHWKLFVNWLTLTWANAQEQKPFPLEKLQAKLR